MSVIQDLILLNNVAVTGGWFAWAGGQGEFKAEGTFGGATVSLQYQGPGFSVSATGIDFGSNTTLTASGGGLFWAKAGTMIRAAITGGVPANIFSKAGRVDWNQAST